VVRAAVVGLGSQVPGAVRQEELWERFFAQRSCGKKAERIRQRAGVETRRGAILPFEEDVSSWGTGARMRRFVAEAPPLVERAVAECLETAGLDAGQVGLIAVASCTGYAPRVSTSWSPATW
jgi:predicted naringenin-chalcone synthase